jgi:hypothetical protein
MAGRHRRVRPVTGRGRHRNPPRRGHIVLPSLAVAAVLGIGGVSAGAVLGAGHGTSADVVPVGQPRVSVSASSAPSAPAQAAAPAPVASTASPVHVRPAPDFAVTVTGRVCWVQVVGPGGRTLYAGLLRHGRTLSFAQRPLQVTLGNAGAVRLVLHHRAHAHAGKQGQVLQFRYG